MQKNYQALVEDKIYFGGASDVEDMVKNEGVEVVVDLRGEATVQRHNTTLISDTILLCFIFPK